MEMNEKKNVQDGFLAECVKGNKEWAIVGTNGFQMKGRILSFDNFCVIVDCGNGAELVYKHAISTIKKCGNCRKF